MKIRIKGNTIRLRLVKTEVKLLQEQGYVEEKTEFSSVEFSYRLEAKEAIHRLEAQFSNNKIIVYIPKSEALIWYDSDQITYKNNFEKLLLLIEKDFVCLDHTDEDQSDNYANPNSTC